ncbi:ornithine cyclodeaminase family protein [Streptomyces sp. NA04227]|uniref:ornithine cyclodeaminase family protein n=1 Tax=Streptomyces sp. NA04227 TaxID=2742136 RepID=UPI0015917473|nr:ornithine cyclodeaminase family protein [Streptomyces sp. NA04227]QKW09689.1 ornithine cyclodeaminase family protein [Streptomyces sp. NA04227]
MLLLTDEQVRASLRMDRLVAALRDGYRVEAEGAVQLPDRINLDTQPGFFRLMPGIVGGAGVMGFKVFNQVAAGGVQYLIGLYDEATGELQAQLDGAYLTAARTGAATGVAAGLLGPDGPVEVGLIGSGLEAETNLEGVCAALDVAKVSVFSPNAERRGQFADRMAERLGIAVEPVDAAEKAASAPVVVVATNTGMGTGRVALRGDWLSPGATVLSIGSTMPALREIDVEVITRAALVVSDAPAQARGESGDLIAADEAGVLDGKLRSLADLATGGAPRQSQEDIAVYKSVGTALQDLVAARVVYESALAGGVGKSIDLLRVKKPAGS